MSKAKLNEIAKMKMKMIVGPSRITIKHSIDGNFALSIPPLGSDRLDKQVLKATGLELDTGSCPIEIVVSKAKVKEVVAKLRSTGIEVFEQPLYPLQAALQRAYAELAQIVESNFGDSADQDDARMCQEVLTNLYAATVDLDCLREAIEEPPASDSMIQVHGSANLTVSMSLTY